MQFPFLFTRWIVFQAYTILCFLVACKANCCCLFLVNHTCTLGLRSNFIVYLLIFTIHHWHTLKQSPPAEITFIPSINRFTCTRAFYTAKISQISWLPSHPSLNRRRFGRPWCPPGVVVQHSICGDNQLAGWQKISEWARRSCISSALWRSTLLPHNLWATFDSISVGMSVYIITHIHTRAINNETLTSKNQEE